MAFNLDLVNPGEEMPRRRVLEDGTYIIGRGKAAKIVLPYPEISERHALLVLRGEKAQLEDMHSANGTYVNGMPIQDLVELNGDAVVQIGDCMLRISPATSATNESSTPSRSSISSPSSTSIASPSGISSSPSNPIVPKAPKSSVCPSKAALGQAQVRRQGS